LTRYAYTADVNVPRYFLYDLWTDPERMPEWVNGLTRVTDVSGLPGVAGTKYRFWYGSMDERVEVEAAEFPLYVRTRSRFGTIKVETAMAFEQTNAGTRLRLAWVARGIKARIWARVVSMGDYRWTFRADLERFVALAEREFAASGHSVRPDLIPMMAPTPLDEATDREPALPLGVRST
jgi:Activator of Hsp90 ATPase homolog 1-like protein